MGGALFKISLHQHYSVSWLTKQVPKSKCHLNRFVRAIFAYYPFKHVHFRTVVVRQRTVYAY